MSFSANQPKNRRKLLQGITGATLATLAAPNVHAQTKVRWRMVTSWPKNLTGPGVAAAFIAERIGELSGGQFEIQVFAAGEILPALQVLDGVSNGTVEMGHSASFFWQGKQSASAFFTTIPFGLDAMAHQAWLHLGGGQALWEDLYAPFNVVPRLAGNTGASMAGWFKREIHNLDDVKGLRIRSQGLGGEVWQALGALAVAIAPSDLLPALSSGVIDAVEFLAPANDLPLGLYKPAPFYYAPGWNKPNGAAEAIFHRPAWEALPQEFRLMLNLVCEEAHGRGLVEVNILNSQAIEPLIREHNVQLRRFSPEIVQAARRHTQALMADKSAKNPSFARIYQSYEEFRAKTKTWQQISLNNALALEGV